MHEDRFKEKRDTFLVSSEKTNEKYRIYVFFCRNSQCVVGDLHSIYKGKSLASCKKPEDFLGIFNRSVKHMKISAVETFPIIQKSCTRKFKIHEKVRCSLR